MFQPAPIPFPPLKTLESQKDDFTAEGAPPPGKVAKAVPVVPGKAAQPVSRLPLAVPGGHTRWPSGYKP